MTYARVYTQGRRPNPHRPLLSGVGLLALLGLGVATVAIVDSMGTTRTYEGVVEGRGSKLVGKILLPSAEIRLTEGPYNWRKVEATDALGRHKIGDTVMVDVTTGLITGSLYAENPRKPWKPSGSTP